jgi:hypothetical protein
MCASSRVASRKQSALKRAEHRRDFGKDFQIAAGHRVACARQHRSRIQHTPHRCAQLII